MHRSVSSQPSTEPGSGPDDAPPSDSLGPGALRLAAGLLLALQLVLLLHAAWRVGPTIDEHQYLAAGYAYLEDGDFSRNREHPPLLKLLIALPLWLEGEAWFPAHWRDLLNYPVAFFYQQNLAQLDRNLFLARLLPSLLTWLGSLAVFVVGRRLFGGVGGLVALLLFAFNPNVLAHGPLAALDAGVAVLIFMAVAAFAHLMERPSAGRALAAGVLFGLGNLAKFTGLLLLPIELGLGLLASVQRRSLRPLGWTALVFLAGLGVFSAGYRFEARSFNSAWAEPPYVEDVGPRRPLPTAAELAEVARAKGVPAGVASRMESAPSTYAAIELLGDQLDGPSSEAALDALATLAPAPSDARKLAFARVLEARAARAAGGPSGEGAAGRDLGPIDRVLSTLGRTPPRPSQERWEAWFEATRSEGWDRTVFTQGWIARPLRRVFGDERPIPLFSAWKGLDYQLRHGSLGHGSYYRGRTLTEHDFRGGNPHRLYYLDVLLVKHPLAWLLAVALGLAAWWRRGPHRTWLRSAALVGAPLALLWVFMGGNALMGIRYVLAVVPFLAVLGGAAALVAPRLALVLGVLAALLGNAHHPHQLMYYGAFAGLPEDGPGGGARITVVGDDWGQGLRAFGRFVERHRAALDGAGGLHYEPYHEGDPAAFGLGGLPPVDERLLERRGGGIVAVNAVSYFRDVGPDGVRKYAWLDAYTPFHSVDRSIWLFDTRGGPPGGNPLAARDAAATGE